MIELIWIILAAFSVILVADKVDRQIKYDDIVEFERETERNFRQYLDSVWKKRDDLRADRSAGKSISSDRICLSISSAESECPGLSKNYDEIIPILSPPARDDHYFALDLLNWEDIFNAVDSDALKSILPNCSHLRSCAHPIVKYSSLLDASRKLKNLEDEHDTDNFEIPFFKQWPWVLAFAFGLRLSRALAAFKGLT